MAAEKTLLAFDFDQTVVDETCDVAVQNLYSLPFPDEINRLYKTVDGWPDFMAAMFSLLHQSGIGFDDIKQKILTIPLVSGMKELFEHLLDDSYEVIIVSDANSLFIDWLLAKHDIREQVRHVYSNPAEVNEEGKLIIQYYHQQDWCNLSSRNMCKGNIY